MKKIEKIIACPKCKNKLEKKNISNIKCNKCQTYFQYKNNKYYFLKPNLNTFSNWFDKIKFKFKRNAILYEIIVKIISPVYPGIDNIIKKTFKKQNKNSIIINLGSGNTSIIKNIINIDMYPYKNVDIITDIVDLPIMNNSVDLIINVSVLEHVKNPQTVLKECHRILKKDGIIITFLPFIQGFHASPHDFSRYTQSGIIELHKNFKKIEVGVGGGPTSGFLWVFQEWFALLLSFNIEFLYRFWIITTMIITFPIKYIDIILCKFKNAKNIASTFYYIGRKIK
jgi:SAM-dependent methyltransferase